MSASAVYLALGSNLGDRKQNLRNALTILENKKVLLIDKMSSIYETEPKYVAEQPDFLNMTLQGRTTLDAFSLLKACKAIEKEMGRNFQEKRYGPRVIDIDILFFDSEIIVAEDLSVPHPKIAERRFVLEPLAEIAGEMLHPQYQRTIASLLENCPDSGRIRKIKSSNSWISH